VTSERQSAPLASRIGLETEQLQSCGNFFQITNAASRRPPADPKCNIAMNRARYLTSRNSGRRREPAGDSCSGASISSHSAFSSTSLIPLILIRSSRIATETKCAVSSRPLARSPASHCSRLSRIESNCSFELTTGALSVPQPARCVRGDPSGRPAQHDAPKASVRQYGKWLARTTGEVLAFGSQAHRKMPGPGIPPIPATTASSSKLCFGEPVMVVVDARFCQV
jgi:hypothetical protein